MEEGFAVHGLEESDNENYVEALIVEEADGNRIEVPVFDVQPSAFAEYEGDILRSVTFNRVFVWNGKLAAEAWLKDGTVIEMTETDIASGEFRAAHITNPSGVDEADEELWRSPMKTEQELTMLTEQDLSAAEVLDFWATEMNGLSMSEWAKRRGVSHQAVSENRRKAREKINDGV